MPHKHKSLFIAMSALFFAHSAISEVYISPVMKNTVSSGMPSSISIIAEPAPELQDWSPDEKGVIATPVKIEDPVKVATVEQVATVEPPKKEPVLSSGTNVPIDIALKGLLGGNGWHIVHDRSADKKVSWRNAADADDGIAQIERHSNLYIRVNEESKQIGISPSERYAEKLMMPGNQVWKLVAGESLRDNLAAWGKQAGWKVDFSQTMINYPVDHDAILVGKFSGEGGVIDQVLQATSGREAPLVGRFYRANNVVVIVESGYKSEENRIPDFAKQ